MKPSLSLLSIESSLRSQEGCGGQKITPQLLNEEFFSKATRLKSWKCYKKTLWNFTGDVSTGYVAARVVTDRQTDTHTHTHTHTQNDYCNPMVHAPRVNEYCTYKLHNCTVVHPSSAQFRGHLHKLQNKWILYCVPPLICTSSTSSAQVAYCISEFHHSSAQVNIIPWVPSPDCMLTNARVPLDCVTCW